MKEHAAAALNALWPEIVRNIAGVLDLSHGDVRMRELFSSETPRLGVLTSLAAGADQLGARTALDAAAQSAVIVELEAILPFTEEDYPGSEASPRPEFHPADAAALRELAARASQVIRIAAHYDDSDARRRGYERARDLLLQNSDVLVAIYDSRAHGKAAGTVETVDIALKSGMAVVAVLLGDDEARIGVVHSKAGGRIEWNDAYAIESPEWRSRLAECIRELLVVPELLSGDAHGAVQRLKTLSGDARIPWLCANAALAKMFAATWRGIHGAASAVVAREPAKERAQAADKITLEPFAGFYRSASTLAEAFMRTYRGAFVLSYVLAGVAVAAAVAMMAAMILTHNDPPAVLVAILCAIKIAILLVLLALERAGSKGRLQEAATELRYLAELLRPMQWLSPVGIYPPAVELPLHAAPHDPRRSWMVWLARAVARSAPCVPGNREVTMTAAVAASALRSARTQWIEGQVHYHEKNAARMRTLEEGLERLAKAMLWIVLVAVVVACVLELVHAQHVIAVLLGATAAVLPAFIAGLGGIAFQSEAKRLATRSAAMVRALVAEQNEMDAAAARIESGSMPHDEAIRLATTILKKASSITIAEAGDWKVLYEVHEIHAG